MLPTPQDAGLQEDRDFVLWFCFLSAALSPTPRTVLGTRQPLDNYLMGSNQSGLGSAIPSVHPHGDYATDLGPTGLGRGVHLAGGSLQPLIIYI